MLGRDVELTHEKRHLRAAKTATGGHVESAAANRRGNDGAVARSDPSMVRQVWR